MPIENEYYLHRIGRTGRAQKEGEAFTLVTYADTSKMADIVRYTRIELEDLKIDA